MSKRPFGTYACFLEVESGEKPDDCVLNIGDALGCDLATFSNGRERKHPDSCPFWRKVSESVGIKKIVHVNRQHIAMNAKDGGTRPVYTIKIGSKTRYAREVIINGPSRMIYDGRQLACGARAWIETEAEIELIDEMTFTEARAAA